MDKELKTNGYFKILSELKQKVRSAQIKASVAVNTELITLYWEMGKIICEQQKKQGWGSKVIERLSTDLQKEFPGMKGFSVSNLRYVKKFY